MWSRGAARRGSLALHPFEEQADGIRRHRSVPGRHLLVPSEEPVAAASMCSLNLELGAVLRLEPTQLAERRHLDYFS